MIGTEYTISNKQGVSFKINDHVTDPLNLIALQSYPQFDVEIKNNEISKEGQHGSWDFYSYYGRRTIGLQGVIIGENEEEVERQKDLMLEVLSLPLQPTTGNDGFVYLSWTDLNGNDWQIECKLQSNIQFSRQMKQIYKLDFNFTLKAPSPFIYGQDLNSVVGTRGYTFSGGAFPLDLPAIMGEGQANILSVNNGSKFDAQTIIKIYGEVDGPITNPRVLNLTTGKTFYLSSTIADETEWIEINSETGTVVNQDGDDLSGEIIGDSEFTILTPGVNEIVYLSDEDPLITLYLPTAPLVVQFRNVKI